MHPAVVILGLFASALYALVAHGVSGRAPAQALTMVRAHGVIAVYLALLPAIPSTLGDLALPPLLGAGGLAPRARCRGGGLRRVALPRRASRRAGGGVAAARIPPVLRSRA